jgi:Ca2+-transporting ATPase
MNKKRNESLLDSVDEPWAEPYQDILAELDVSAETGLDAAEVKQQRKRYGPNRLRQAGTRSAWQVLADQFRSLVVVLLIVAALASFVFGERTESIAIVAVVIINAAIGFFTELRAVRSMEALQTLGQVSVKARRDGQVQEISADKLVPGDVVVVEGGDIVTADVRLVEASKLQADESALTGESMPVTKAVEPAEEDAPLAERSSMLFKGTAVTRGSGEGIVVATGMHTELGHISSLVEEAEEESTPLEARLEQLGRRLVAVTLIIAVLVALMGFIAGKELLLIVETSIALAVATVPEGLPIVATLALARGMWRMARREALINRLSAVETLGATNVICTDKTGTLTENQMTVTEIALEQGLIRVTGEGLQTEGQFSRNSTSVDPKDTGTLGQLLKVGILCNNAELQNDESGDGPQAVGEPEEVALLVAGAKAGFSRNDLLEKTPEVREDAFDPDIKMMATYHRSNGQYAVAVKGAPAAVVNACSSFHTEDGVRQMSDSDSERWLDRSASMAEDGLRVLALAMKTVDEQNTEPYKGLSLLGLAGLLDPPREEVRPSLDACKEAGVRVVMVTGDHPATARKIAKAVGLVQGTGVEVIQGSEVRALEDLSEEERERIQGASILARVSPEQKLDLIALHQDNGAIVAMTGDGVNDAPALKKADIGVAMGKRGTEVAQEAADMVLRDDAFSSIVAAVEQGRVIFGNIRKFVFYLLSCNISEILVVSVASLVNAPLPVRPLQILYLNLVTDVFPALALGVGEGDALVMKKPPRDPQEPVLTRDHWQAIGGYGALITFSVMGAFALAFNGLEVAERKAVTISFLTLAFAQLWHVFNMREAGSSMLRNEVTRNPYVWGALALCIGLLAAAVYFPILADLLKTEDPGLTGWSLVIVASLIPLVIGQSWKRFSSANQDDTD